MLIPTKHRQGVSVDLMFFYYVQNVSQKYDALCTCAENIFTLRALHMHYTAWVDGIRSKNNMIMTKMTLICHYIMAI